LTLRRRLLAASLAVALPLALILFYASEWIRLRGMEEALSRYVESPEFLDARARCEFNPAAFGQGRRGGGPGIDPNMRRGGPPPAGVPPFGPGPPPGRGRGEGPPYELFAYDALNHPANPNAPEFPDTLSAQLAAVSQASGTFATPDGRGVEIAVASPNRDGGCATILARVRPRPGEIRDERIALAVVIVSVFGAVWVAAGPVVVRMRRLTEAVGRSAASRYEVPVSDDGGGELADLARAFNAAGASVKDHLRQAESREAALRDFVANTTHDVALPLTVLQGHLAEIEKDAADGSAAREHVRAAVQEAHYMSSLLRNLGVAARLDRGTDRIERRAVNLNAVVDRVIARQRPVARMLGVELNHAVPEEVLSTPGDVTLIEQAVSNLTDNAVRYNTTGGHVAVVLDRRGDRFVLTVADDGPGVAVEELSRLTERRFRSEDARTRRPDGHGLGLSIAAEALARLDCSLVFRPSAERGLTAEISGNLVSA